MLADETTRLAVFSSSLNSTHPKNVLDRGCNADNKQDGTVVSNSQDLAKGQQVILALSDGEAKATIDEIELVNEMSKDMNYSKAIQRLEEIVQSLGAVESR